MEENQLITRLKAKDEVAFKYLVEKYQRQVYNTVLSILQNAEESEDVSQEVFIEIYHSIAGFNGNSKLSTWIYRIASTKALELYRRNHAQKRFSFLTSLFGKDKNELRFDAPDFDHPGIQLENKEKAAILFKAIDKLPENQKLAFNLYNIEGLSYLEISEVMQSSVSSVESLIFRAKGNLKVSLQHYYKTVFKTD